MTAPITMPAIAPAEMPVESLELADDISRDGDEDDDAVVLDKDEVDAEEAVDDAEEDVEVATAPRNVCASVSTPTSPAQQSLLSPQHHFVELSVPSHGVIITLLLA